jgi:hypothetical protein
MSFRMLLAALLASGVVSCALPQGAGSRYSPDVFAHRVTDGHVVLYWNCAREGGMLKLEGVAQSPWEAQPIRFLKFELVGVGAQDRSISRAAGEARGIQISTNQIAPFHLDLNATGSEARFDLYYRYQFLEGEEMSARLAGPPEALPRILAQTNVSLVRDACAEGEHRAH